MPDVACLKIPYVSRADATRAAKAAPGQRPYLCPHCGAYHLSSKSRREVKANRRGRFDPARKIDATREPLVGGDS